MKTINNKSILHRLSNYQPPKVELLALKSNLSFLAQSFSSDGEFDPIDDGGEFGVDEDGNPID